MIGAVWLALVFLAQCVLAEENGTKTENNPNQYDQLYALLAICGVLFAPIVSTKKAFQEEEEEEDALVALT